MGRLRTEKLMEGQGYDGKFILYGNALGGCLIVSTMLRGVLDFVIYLFGVLIWESTLVWCLFV